MKPINRSSAALILAYSALSATLPFLLSYKESHGIEPNTYKGTISSRSLFNKI
ncbi:hypothetical protein G9P44_001845 [Scheffersomyces stipitis]|nr:hypothetical protein G9P44_001845 [Scheffersomyces stipitis]